MIFEYKWLKTHTHTHTHTNLSTENHDYKKYSHAASNISAIATFGPASLSGN